MDQPQAPDPKDTASAQLNSNVNSSVASSFLNNVNQVGPTGTVGYQQMKKADGSPKYYRIQDANGNTVKIPRLTQTTTLSPGQQQLYDQQTRIGQGMNDLALSQIDRLQGVLNQPFSLDSLPARVDSVGSSPDLAKSYATFDLNDNIDPAGDIQKSIGPTDYSEDRRRVEEALMSRYNTDFDKRTEATDAKLRAQGLTPGTEAWQDQYQTLGRDWNDAEMQAILAGGQEQSRLADLELQKGNFANAAQQQQWNENFAKTGLFNANQNQRQSVAAALAGFGNSASEQEFQNAIAGGEFANTARANALKEMLAARNQPINEITALMSGGQVSMPDAYTPYQSDIAAPPVGQYIQDNYDQSMSAYNNMMQGLFGLGQTALSGFMRSDERSKTDTKRVGFTDEGLPIYTYAYKGDPFKKHHMGLMAQDLEVIKPSAVATEKTTGLKMVDYSKVGNPTSEVDAILKDLRQTGMKYLVQPRRRAA